MQSKYGIDGYLTVYLALIMTILISLYLALIEGVRSNAIRLEAECVMDIGLNSVLAEYHRELQHQYNLFAVDTSYGTQKAGSGNVEQHLESYMDRNFSMEGVFLSEMLYKDFLAMSVKQTELKRASILTDENGAVFRARAVEAIRDDTGLSLFKEFTEWIQVVENNGLNSRNVWAEKEEIDRQIAAYNGTEVQLNEKEWVVVEMDNPTRALDDVRRKGILHVVVQDPEIISEKRISEEELIASRMLKGEISVGNWGRGELSRLEELKERFLFQEYLLKYLQRFGDGSWEKEAALSYQIEYLIAGETSDMNNLKKVANTLCAMREAANAVYLYSNASKCAEAEAFAVTIATLCYVPEAAEILKHAVLLGWAYAESLYDMEVLLDGGQIPILKDDSTWHYSLNNALQAEGSLEERENDSGTGLFYEDYLRILMSLTDMDALTSRAMNMIEADIRLTKGNQNFRLDACYDCMEIYAEIESAYGYHYEITRRKQY